MELTKNGCEKNEKKKIKKETQRNATQRNTTLSVIQDKQILFLDVFIHILINLTPCSHSLSIWTCSFCIIPMLPSTPVIFLGYTSFQAFCWFVLLLRRMWVLRICTKSFFLASSKITWSITRFNNGAITQDQQDFWHIDRELSTRPTLFFPTSYDIEEHFQIFSIKLERFLQDDVINSFWTGRVLRLKEGRHNGWRV